MQEQVNEKTMSLIFRGTKFTGRMLEKALNKLLADMKRQKQKGAAPKSYKGKQSVKELVKQGAGVINIEIADEGLKRFEGIARKYGVDFAIKKDVSETPPKWLVFFKARDEHAMTAAFNEYTSKSITRGPKKPSLLSALRKNVELIKNQVVDKVRNKRREGPEL